MSDELDASKESHREEPPAEIDPAMLSAALEKLRAEQNLSAGLGAAVVAAVVGAAIWALITVTTEYQIGWMAVGVGFLVGAANRWAGKGIDKVFAVVGAGSALFGCMLGNLFTVLHFVGEAQDLGVVQVLTMIDPGAIPDLMIATFSPMDLLFYGIAVYEGYKLSLRELTDRDIARAIEAPVTPR